MILFDTERMKLIKLDESYTFIHVYTYIVNVMVGIIAIVHVCVVGECDDNVGKKNKYNKTSEQASGTVVSKFRFVVPLSTCVYVFMCERCYSNFTLS